MTMDASIPALPRRDDPDAAAAADPTTPSVELARIASARPDLQAAIAVNPAATPGVLDFIMRFGGAEAKSAVAQRGKASGASAFPGYVGYPSAPAVPGGPGIPVGPSSAYGSQPPRGMGATSYGTVAFGAVEAPPRRERRKGLIAVIVVLVLALGAGGAGGAWWWSHRDESAGARGENLGTTDMSSDFSREPEVVWSHQANKFLFSADGTRMIAVSDPGWDGSTFASRRKIPDYSHAYWELFSFEGGEPRSIASGEGVDATENVGFWDDDAVVGNIRVNGSTGEQTTLDWLDNESRFIAGAGSTAVVFREKDRLTQNWTAVGVSADSAEQWRLTDHRSMTGWALSATVVELDDFGVDGDSHSRFVDIATGSVLANGELTSLRAQRISGGIALYSCGRAAGDAKCGVSAYKDGQTAPFDSWEAPYIAASPSVSPDTLKDAGATAAADSGSEDDTYYALDASGSVHSLTGSEGSPQLDGHDLDRPADVNSSARAEMVGMVGSGSLTMIQWWDIDDSHFAATSVHDASTGELLWSVKDSTLVSVVSPGTILTRTATSDDGDHGQAVELRRAP